MKKIVFFLATFILISALKCQTGSMQGAKIPSPTGKAGMYLKTNGTTLSWAQVVAGLSGTLTANRIPYATAVGTLSNSSMYQLNDNIGIATPTPSYNLDVNGSARIATTPTITNANNVLVKDPSTGQISEMPFSKIVFINNTNPSGATIFDLKNPPTTNDNSLKNRTDAIYISPNSGLSISNGTVYTIFSNTTAWQLATGASTVVVDALGNKGANICRTGFVGIGTTSVTASFHVRSTGTTSATFPLKIDNLNSNSLLNVRSDGNVGIATPTPSYNLDVNGSARIATTPTITNASNVLVKNPITGQISEQAIGGTQFANVVYFDNTDPNLATIFDLNNPPTTNDNSLKNRDDVVYIGTDANSWTSNMLAYSTYVAPASTAWQMAGTTNDAGSNKTGAIYRLGNIGIATPTPSYNLDVNGSARIATTPTITNASNVLVKNPITGQISEQAIGGTQFDNVVYFNNTNPTSATIFDLNNPPTTNDNSLKNRNDVIYIGTNASTWTSNMLSYSTYIAPSSTAFSIIGTSTDAGNNKTSKLWRNGGILLGEGVSSSSSFNGYFGALGNFGTNPSLISFNDTRFPGAGFSVGNAGGANFLPIFGATPSGSQRFIFGSTVLLDLGAEPAIQLRITNSSLGPISNRPLFTVQNGGIGGFEAFRITSNGSIGIKNSSPTALVHAKGTGTTSSTYSLKIDNSNNNSLLNVRDDGNVGIGVASPNSKLHVQSASTANMLFEVLDNAGGQASIDLKVGTANNWRLICQGTLNGTRLDFHNQILNSPAISIMSNNRVGIGTTNPNASAKLQVNSTTQGFLPPTMTDVQKNNIVSPAVGLIIYVTDGDEGLYIYSSGGWRKLNF
jgi:hypothetical protein